MGIGNIGGAQPINMISLEGLDLESMIMAVQTNRVNVLDEQIKSKMEVVQARNVRINELNANMSGMNAAIQRIGGDGAATNSLTGTALTDFLAAAPKQIDTAAMESRTSIATIANSMAAPGQQNQTGQSRWLKEEMVKQGYPVSTAMAGLPTTASGTAAVNLTDAQQATFKAEANAFRSWLNNPESPTTMKTDPEAAKVTTRGQAEAYVKSLQTQIDSLGNTQQMDMLNLQSLSNKRNEAFEIMTNFMKKFNDSRAGIIQKF